MRYRLNGQKNKTNHPIKNLIIMATFNFTTKQEGYGRQGLYFSFDGKQYFIQSVFPNVKEHFEIECEENCFYDEDTETYKDYNGDEIAEDHMYYSLDSWLTENLKEKIGKSIYDHANWNDYDFDFENATYKEISEWAANY